MKFIYRISLFTLVIVLGSQHIHAQSRKAKDFVAEYMSIAFNDQGEFYQPLQKWHGLDTLYYHVAGELPYFTETSWQAFLDEIEALTGLSVQRTEEEDCHILIFVGPLRQFAALRKVHILDNLLDKYPVWNSHSHDGKYSLTHCQFAIDPGKVRNNSRGMIMIKHAFITALGLKGTSTFEYSIFADTLPRSYRRIPRYDRRFIKMHYHPALSPGMKKYQVKNALFALEDLEAIVREKL